MSTIKRTSVEPLSRPAWDRIEANVFARLDRGEHLQPSPTTQQRARSGRVWVAAGVFAAAASLLLWSRGRSSDTHEPQATALAPAAAVAAEPADTSLSSGETSREAAIAGALLVLAPHSSALVSGSNAAGWRVRLDGGEVDFAVEPRAGRPPFVVDAGDTKVSVVGTRFTVKRVGSSASVRVQEGKVKVATGESLTLLGPGDSWPSAPALLDEPPHRQPIATEPAAPAAGKAAAEAQRRFQKAARLESKSPETALAIYRRLSREGGPWAATALFAQARLELDLARPRRAEALLREYLRRHPSGVNVKDARELLEKAATASAAPGQQPR